MAETYAKNSITLLGAIVMGTGVMIGAGIFALTGQIAELAGPLFPLSFVVGAIVTAFSSLHLYQDVECIPVCGWHRDDTEKGLRADNGRCGRRIADDAVYGHQRKSCRAYIWYLRAAGLWWRCR